MDVCSICLEPLLDTHLLKTLSCGHTFHYQCFCRLSYSKASFFMNCPLCRVKNFNVDYPSPDAKFNLLSLCSPNLEKQTCSCLKKNGKPCQNKTHLFNYGFCHNHYQPALKKKHMKPFLNYIRYIFTSNNKGFKTKLYMLDMAKQLIIKHDIQNVDEILLIFHCYFEKTNYQKDRSYIRFYKEHGLKEPLQQWVDFCCEKKLLF
jgi:hypothetical protein